MALARREFVQLAQKFDPTKMSIAGWWASIKLDGWRAYWDGSITRGMDVASVPWGNTARESHYIIPPKATGLWSRYGRPINAPGWFLDQLPPHPLDGELWMGRGTFQKIMSATRRLTPGDEWDDVKYMVFGAPSYREMFQDGEIRLKGKYEKVFRGFADWAIERAKDGRFLREGRTFEETYTLLREILTPTDNMQLHHQVRLPYSPSAAVSLAIELAEAEVKDGGEGMIVCMGGAFWVPKRARTMLKVKPWNDDEGKIIGYVWGKETDLGSKLLGLMGSAVVSWNGRTFNLSGFTDEERAMTTVNGERTEEGFQRPGMDATSNVHNPKFPRGTTITFQYREITNDGIPKEARYLRVRPEE